MRWPLYEIYLGLLCLISRSTLLVIHVFVTVLFLGATFVLRVFLVVIIFFLLFFFVAIELKTVVILEFLEGLNHRGEAEGLEA